MNCLQRIQRILHRDPFWAEVWSALSAVGWATWVLQQPADLETGQSYRVVTGIASDGTWEWAGFTIGAVQLVAIALDMRFTRFLAAFLAAAYWLCLAYGIWLDNKSAPGVVLYMAQGAANMTTTALISLRKD